MNMRFFHIGLLIAMGLAQTGNSHGAEPTNRVAKASAPLAIADFENGKLVTKSGSAWVSFTDATLAGKSALNATVGSSGAGGSKGAMVLTGKLTPDVQWGGFAGITGKISEDGSATNLSRFTGVQFMARGDGKAYRVVIGKENVKDSNHFSSEFQTKSEWTQIKVAFTELAQSEAFGTKVPWSADNITAVAFMAMGQPQETREFKLEIDNVSFY
jgi:hypothetical protein